MDNFHFYVIRTFLPSDEQIRMEGLRASRAAAYNVIGLTVTLLVVVSCRGLGCLLHFRRVCSLYLPWKPMLSSASAKLSELCTPWMYCVQAHSCESWLAVTRAMALHVTNQIVLWVGQCWTQTERERRLHQSQNNPVLNKFIIGRRIKKKADADMPQNDEYRRR